MRTPQRSRFAFLAIFMVLSIALTGFGAAAQGETEVAQPGGDLPGDPSIQLVKVADGLLDPINIQSAHDGSGRLFVLERTGTVRIVQDGEVLETPFLDISQEVKIDFLEQGLLGMAFHPDYANNGRFFVYYSDYRTNGDHFLVEFTVSEDDPNVANPDSARLLLSVEDPYVNHNGGTMEFGPDGYLYLTIGDGGMAGDPYRNAQDTSNLLGKILRLDVDSQIQGMPYGIPADNPFADIGGVNVSSIANEAAQTGDYVADAAPEIWVYGLRNAWQFSFDPATGDMFIADVGQVVWEEINYIPADEVATGGHNFGWHHMEAAHCYPPDENEECDFFGVMPVAEYEHGADGCSITGIGVYRGEQSPDLDGIYFASDWCSGKVWGLQMDDAGAWQFEELLDTDLLVTGAGQDDNGELYVTACECQFSRDYNPFDNPTGTVWQLVSTDAVPEGAETAPGAEAQQDATPETQDEQMTEEPEASPED